MPPLLLGLLLFYAVTYVFLPPPPVSLKSLDESWRAFLVWAFENHKQFGTEIIFTYGPWGFLFEPRGTYRIYPWLIFGRSILAIALASSIYQFAKSAIPSPRLRWLWAAAIALLGDPLIFVPLFLWLNWIRSGEPAPPKIHITLLSIASGLAACSKFTSFLLVASLLPLLLIRAGWRWPAFTVVFSFLAFWLGSAQDVSHIIPFVKNSMEIASGYSSAMVNGRPSYELLLAMILCATALLLAWHSLGAVSRIYRLGALAWFSFLQLIVFRHATIRNDTEHVFMGLFAVGLPVCIALLAPALLSRKPAIACFLATVLAALSYICSGHIQHRFELFQESLSLYPTYAMQTLFLPSPPPVSAPPSSAATLDVFPHELAYPIRHGLALRNRPIVQSYSAYTPLLCEKSAAFLESPEAPSEIYVHSGAIDSRYPTMEDSLAWRSLLTHYTTSAFRDGFLILRKRPAPLRYQLEPLMSTTLPAGTALDVPGLSTPLVWATLEARSTALGKLSHLFFRNEKMVLEVTTTSRKQDFRLLDETTKAGFLLSPLLETPASMQNTFGPKDPSLSEFVTRIRVLQGRASSLAFQRDVRVQLFSLRLIPQ